MDNINCEYCGLDISAKTKRQIILEHAKENGIKGGNSTYKKHGKKQMVAMVKKRWANAKKK